MIPSFVRELSNPNIINVFLTGCGGGFDFVHTLNLYKDLVDCYHKNIVIGSYSFGDPTTIQGGECVFLDVEGVYVYKVNGSCTSTSNHYNPEILICQFLDLEYPDKAPHFIYTYCARAFCIPKLRHLYELICAHHDIHSVICVDGGSDSLMIGDEEGLGDPIEDAVSIGAIATLQYANIIFRCLLIIGLGVDRYNDVSDASSLRAIAELTSCGAFLGSISLEPMSPSFLFYKSALEYIYSKQSFRSVLAGAIVSSVEGCYGNICESSFLTQHDTNNRVYNNGKPNTIFFWPISAIMWGFNIEKVAERSIIVQTIMNCETVKECNHEFEKYRRLVTIRALEELPSHKDYSIVYLCKMELKSDNISTGDHEYSSEKSELVNDSGKKDNCNIS
jgi:hypothetical protein